MKTVTKVVLLALLSTLWGCTNSLRVTGELPTPLIKTIPQSVSVLYDKDFKQYVYTETSEDRGKWVISSGEAQTRLFNQVLPELFESVEEIKALPTRQKPANTDLVLYPSVSEFQYSVPRETKFKVYEVWIKYNLKVFEGDGDMIADWIVTAYGKTPTAFMLSNEDAMNAAVIVALRDLGANLSLGTRRVPEIKMWLDSHAPPPVTQQASAGGAVL